MGDCAVPRVLEDVGSQAYANLKYGISLMLSELRNLGQVPILEEIAVALPFDVLEERRRADVVGRVLEPWRPGLPVLSDLFEAYHGNVISLQASQCIA